MTGKPPPKAKPPLRRDQHAEFGKELRGLLGSTKSEDKEIAGIVIDETNSLAAKKGDGQKHPKEESLHGDDLRSVGYLKIYKGNYSIRVYYTIIDGTIWMLRVESSKRRTYLTEGDEKMLKNRLADVTKTAKKGRTK